MTVSTPDAVPDQASGPELMSVELVPCTRYDSVASVLYCVGDQPYDPTALNRSFSPAMREALSKRALPRQRSARRRYIAAILLEDQEALRFPPHMRPALVRALRMSQWMTGGIMFESQAALGSDPVHRAAAISWLAENAGIPFAHPDLEDLPDPAVALDSVGTFSIGYLGNDGAMPHPSLLHEAVKEWNRDAQNLVPPAERDRERATAEMLHDAVVAEGWQPSRTTFFEPSTSSALVADLSAEAAEAMITRHRAASATTPHIIDNLRLLGYLNRARHRVWNRSLLGQVEGD